MENQKNKIRYPFNNQLMFAKVMENKHICREFIQRLFADRKVIDIEVREIATLTTESTLIPGVYSKSIRLDVRFDDENSWYNIEMQVARETDLPQRGRYYSAAVDIAHLEKGKPYGDLKPSFVIFICCFDYYEKGEAIYTFERFDRKLQLPYSDGSYIILLNTKCPVEKVPDELRSLFHYINTEEAGSSDWFVETIHELVLRYQSDEEVERVATLEEEYMRRSTKAEREGHARGLAAGLAEGRAEGHAEGRAEGRAEATEQLNKLNTILLENGRLDDLRKALQEPAFQKALLEEFGLA